MPTNTLPAPRTHAQAIEALRPYNVRRLIANNTRVQVGQYRHHADPDKAGNDMIIRLHDTDIVTFRADGWVEFKTGGFNTITTKNRLNAYAPDGTRFYSRDRALYFVPREGATPIRVTEGMQYDTVTRRVRHQRVTPVPLAAPRIHRNPAPTEIIDSLDALNTWLRQFQPENTSR